MHKVFTIFRKDVKQEMRSKAAINSILLFAIITLTAVSFSIGNFSLNSDVLAALLWIIILFSALSGFSHVFIKEEDAQTAETLKLITQPNDVLLGKLLFNTLLLVIVLIIIVPLFVGVFNFSVQNPALFIFTVFLGAIGMAAGGTVVAALIAKASGRGALFSVLAFPILLPVIVLGISATRVAFKTSATPLIIPEVQTLIAYCVIVITASILLFEYIWND